MPPDGSHLRIHSKRKCRPQGICLVCGGNKADARVHVATNNFRGDDEVIKAHSTCIKNLKDKTLCLVVWDKMKPIRSAIEVK